MTEHDIQLLKSHFTFWDKLSPHQKDILIGGRLLSPMKEEILSTALT